MPRPGPNVTSDADTQPGSDSLFPTGFSGGGALVRSGSVGTGEIADGSVAAADLNLASVATALAARGEFTGTYASKALANLAARAVPIGDSITYGSDNPANNNSRGLSWPMYAEMVSDGRFHYVRNAGISGNTTAQMLARFDTDVTPYAPTLVPIMGGRNDISQSVPLATYQANIIAIVAKIRAIGAVPWLFTITPTNSTGGQTTRAWNAWLRAYAATNGIPLTDAYEVVVDTTTGNYLSAYNSGDNTHPTEAGYYAIGSRFASDVGRIAASRAIPRLYDAADTLNIMQGSNPLFLTTTITSQAPSGFSLVNSGSVSGSMVTGDTTINGNWYRMTFAASASDVTLFHSGGFVTTAGRKYALTCLINSQLSAAPAGGGLFVQVGTSPGTAYALYAGSTQSQKGRLWASFTAGGTSCNPQVFVKTGTTGTVDIAEWAIFDLTTAGIDSLVA